MMQKFFSSLFSSSSAEKWSKDRTDMNLIRVTFLWVIIITRKLKYAKLKRMLIAGVSNLLILAVFTA
jgi:hypothetical protein